MLCDEAKSGLSIQSAQEQLIFISAHVPVAIAHVAQEGAERRYRFVNQRYAELYGRTAEDVVGKHPRSVLGEDVYARASTSMDRCIAGETVEFELDLDARGETQIVHVRYVPDRDTTGAVTGFLGVITDVTDLRRLQRELEQLRSR